MEDQIYLERALHLAKKGSGHTSPNPMVGAVLVKDGVIIGEGYHARSGDRHAEIAAIENAREPVEGATLYCNLEPCCHETPTKRTPPCTSRIIREGIRKVVISTMDPNPLVSGRGVATLQNAGIAVETGLLADRAALLNQAFFKFIQTHLPFVHLKLAISLDGCIATAGYDSRWITDESARSIVHRWRSRSDAVMVGINSVLKDNPQLTVRLVEGRQPLRIVLDSKLRIPSDTHLLTDRYQHKTHIFTTDQHRAEKRREIERAGAVVHVVGADASGRVQLSAVLQVLGEMHVTSLLIEGGGALATAFIKQGLFDKLSVFLAPVLIGNGVPAIRDLGIQKMSEVFRLDNVHYRQINAQMLVQSYRNLRETLGNVAAIADVSNSNHKQNSPEVKCSQD